MIRPKGLGRGLDALDKRQESIRRSLDDAAKAKQIAKPGESPSARRASRPWSRPGGC